MIPLQIVDRYTRSIFETAQEAGAAEVVFQELAAVRDAMNERPELLELLQSPLITRGEKRSLIQGILGPKTHPLSERFLNLLVDKNRIDLYPHVIERLHEAMNEQRGLQEATVVTARELHPSIIQLLEKALERAVQRKVVIRTETESAVIGGIRVHIGNWLIDGTIRTKLDDLESQLMSMKV